MLAVIYRFELQPHQEEKYQACWETVSEYFVKHCGAIGSCLHKGESGLWVAYSRWPDQATRDAAWPGAQREINDLFPEDVQKAIKTMQAFKEDNQHLQQYEEICLEVVRDKLK